MLNDQKPGIKNLKISKTLESSNVFAYFVWRDYIWYVHITYILV